MTTFTFTNAVAVTPSDSAFISATGAIYVGVAGTLKVMMAGAGNAVVEFTAVPAGTTIPISVKQVFATGTSATSIVALR
jgi:uncharacterized membrane protein